MPNRNLHEITINELMKKKSELEREIMDKVSGPIVNFQRETGVGIKYIDIEMVYVSWKEDVPKYIVSKIAVKLDLDFIEALDSAEKVYNIDKAREQ